MKSKNIEEIFARADIQQIREFFLNGVEAFHTHTDSYGDRVQKPLNRLNERVHEIFQNERECEKMMAVIFDYSTAVEEVHFELGLQVGIMLAIQMYSNFKNALEGDNFGKQ